MGEGSPGSYPAAVIIFLQTQLRVLPEEGPLGRWPPVNHMLDL
jgi:hypothetical protein